MTVKRLNNWGGLTTKEKRLYNIWLNMLQRCENPEREKYASYGGRGIAVCDEWHRFDTFVEWAHESGYRSDLTIDRIDNDGDYCPENCRWATREQQDNNRRSSVVIDVNGVVGTVAQWSNLLEVSQYTIYDWVRRHGTEYATERIVETVRRGGLARRTVAKKVCAHCGAVFKAYAGTAKYCLDCRKWAEREKYRRYRAKKASCGAKVVEE